MKQFFLQLLGIWLLPAAAMAQQKTGTHTFHAQYGFAYASDVASMQDMHRGFSGIGYQFTNQRNWYFGADVQYGRHSIKDTHLGGAFLGGNGMMYSCQNPGGTGYFMVSPGMLQTASIVTSTKVYQTPTDERPATQQNLRTSRLNLVLNGGRRWQLGRSQIEAGINITGTFYSREAIKSNTQRQAITCRVNNSGQLFQSMFDVTTYTVINQRHFWGSGGVHARYQYNITPLIGVGMQVFTTMSTHGLVAQAAPRVTVNFR